MIKENEAYEMLSDTFPNLRTDFEQAGGVGCPYKMAAIFAAFTKKLMRSGKQGEAHKCLDMAESILKDGNDPIKNAMENVYVFSVSQMMPLKKELAGSFPALLFP